MALGWMTKPAVPPLPFDPATAGTYRGFGLLNQFLVQAPRAAQRAPRCIDGRGWSAG
ncbi:hypothetical protein ECZU20_52390 [Escherichia coli]|nr:hypothetical protein ECZU20_52390 [Escherichia coli]